MIRSLILTALLALSSVGNADTHGITISSGSLMLVGSFSTTSTGEGSQLATVGWMLIVIGSLVGGGDLAVGEDLGSSKEMMRSMLLDAKATLRDPKITSGDAISSAISDFEYNQPLTYNEKAVKFSKMVLDIYSESQNIIKNNERVSVDTLIHARLPDNATERNINIVRNLYAISGVY